MKSEKGITLMTLIITIIVLCIVIAMLSTISSLFFSNTEYLKENSKNISEYNKFAMFFIEDCKNNSDITEITDTQIIFKDGTMYTYSGSTDKSIYRNKVKICNNIGYCKFTELEKKETENTTKKIINVHMIINASKYLEANNEYVLKYW